MRLIDLADNIYVGVTDIEAASAWYIEHLQMRPVVISSDDASYVTLGFDKKADIALFLGPRTQESAPSPVFSTSNAEKAREMLDRRGVHVGPIETDRQGTRSFIMRDIEGNEIEIAELP